MTWLSTPHRGTWAISAALARAVWPTIAIRFELRFTEELIQCGVIRESRMHGRLPMDSPDFLTKTTVRPARPRLARDRAFEHRNGPGVRFCVGQHITYRARIPSCCRYS